MDLTREEQKILQKLKIKKKTTNWS